MRNRTVRLATLTLLFTIAIGAGLVAWNAEQRVHAVSSSERTELERFGRIAELLSALGSVQLAYSASPQTNDGWFGHVSRLVDRLEMEAAAVGTPPSSKEPSPPLRAFRDATAVVVQATARARDNLAAGRDVMAADLVLGETRERVEGMGRDLRLLRTARVAEFDTERAALEQRAWTVVGVGAGMWALALLVFARTQRADELEALTPHVLSIASSPQLDINPAPDDSAIDLSKAAELCTAISRVATAEEVSRLLARAASILDASGIILWVSVGEHLVAIGSHGYEPSLITRVSPIPLAARNPTTAAWHSGETATLVGNAESNGAIVAPIWGPLGRIGVLAAELREGREREPRAKALMTLLAAQFSTAIAPSVDERAGPAIAGHKPSELPLNVAGA